MKRFLSVAIAAVVLVSLGGVAFAWMGGGAMGAGPMGRMMGAGPMGGQMMGGSGGPAGCPGVTGASAPGAAGEALTEEKAKTLAQAYADTHLQGFTVEKILPFTGRHGTAYSVELKGPKDEVRVLHVNPFGSVMPFGGPGRRAAG
jgi:hypothetical protein